MGTPTGVEKHEILCTLQTECKKYIKRGNVGKDIMVLKLQCAAEQLHTGNPIMVFLIFIGQAIYIWQQRNKAKKILTLE